MIKSVDFSGFCIESKLICSSKRVLANLYILFKQNLNEVVQVTLSKENSFHSFIDMLDYLSYLIEETLESKIPLITPNFSNIDCIPKSKKFYYPNNLISLRTNNDELILNYDDFLDKKKLLI